MKLLTITVELPLTSNPEKAIVANIEVDAGESEAILELLPQLFPGYELGATLPARAILTAREDPRLIDGDKVLSEEGKQLMRFIMGKEPHKEV